MSSYYYNSRLSYADYLQAKSFVDDIRWDISRANLTLLSSASALSEHGFHVQEGLVQLHGTMQQNVTLHEGSERQLADISDQLSEVGITLVHGFSQIHADLYFVGQTLEELSAKFDWGIAKIESRLGGIADSLEELVRIARTPERTWAYEQFDIARDAFRRGLYPEALEYVQRAIDGHQNHTGYKLEYRFHYLLGMILRGDYKNSSAEFLNLDKAEQAYLNAARYSRQDKKKDAAQALLAAGWVAYCNGKIDNAKLHTEQSLLLFGFAEAEYQLSKILFNRDAPVEGLPHFIRAIKADPIYAVRCFADGDFLKYEDTVRGVIANRNNELLEKLATISDQALQTINYFEKILRDLLGNGDAYSWSRGLDKPDIAKRRSDAEKFKTISRSAPLIDVFNALRDTRGLAQRIQVLGSDLERYMNSLATRLSTDAPRIAFDVVYKDFVERSGKSWTVNGMLKINRRATALAHDARESEFKRTQSLVGQIQGMCGAVRRKSEELPQYINRHLSEIEVTERGE